MKDSIYTKWVGGDTTGLTERLACPIKKYGTVIICREVDNYLMDGHDNDRWKVLSKVELLIELGRGIPIYAYKSQRNWHRVKI